MRRKSPKSKSSPEATRLVAVRIFLSVALNVTVPDPSVVEAVSPNQSPLSNVVQAGGEMLGAKETNTVQPLPRAVDDRFAAMVGVAFAENCAEAPVKS